MTGFELQTSGIGSNRSTNWATQPLPLLLFKLIVGFSFQGEIVYFDWLIIVMWLPTSNQSALFILYCSFFFHFDWSILVRWLPTSNQCALFKSRCRCLLWFEICVRHSAKKLLFENSFSFFLDNNVFQKVTFDSSPLLLLLVCRISGLERHFRKWGKEKSKAEIKSVQNRK